MHPTPEQKIILSSKGDIKINAIAGSGKTTTIIAYAKSRPKACKMLYIAFNKTVKIEAEQRFLMEKIENVRVETAHSLAYKSIVFNSHYRMKKRDYTPGEVLEILGLNSQRDKNNGWVMARHILQFIAFFCNSNESKVQNLDYRELIHEKEGLDFVNQHYADIERYTRQFLAGMNSGKIEITHDFYLKKFQLSKPTLDYDYLLFDEGQDASPVMLDVFLQQKGKKIIVGDTHQQIYRWRHAINSLEKVDFPTYMLSNSFRFPPDIALLAQLVLEWKIHLGTSIDFKIKGLGKHAETKTKAILSRSNLALIARAFDYIQRGKGQKKIFFEGHINSYTFAEDGASLYDILSLYNDKRENIRDPLIRQMRNLEDLEHYIENTGDSQLSMMLQLVEEYGNDIYSLMKLLKENHLEEEAKENANMIFSTVHRCKGMEYDIVELTDDFISEDKIIRLLNGEKSTSLDPESLNEEINILYVAITRARNKIFLPEKLVSPGFKGTKNIIILPSQPSSHNQKWTADMDRKLKFSYLQGGELNQLAAEMGRSKTSILMRLQKLGLEES
jgi:superfamily I DNA/RNA helicase